MGRCARCGEENPARARFCLACGTPLVSEAGTGEVRKIVTVVFTDVTGSTALAEGLDPESVRRVMTSYFDRMRVVLEHHGGTVEKFIGDAVMAVFGVPSLHEDDALRAVRAASDMRDTLTALNQETEARYGVSIQTRTGINTGEVVAGDVSQGQAFASGDTVNVAARLEQAAGPGEILLGEDTFRLVRDAVTTEPVPPLELKGKAGPVPAYRLIAVSTQTLRVARRLDSPFVGRDAELKALRHAFEQAEEERSCRLVTIFGTAGVGKSRLTHEFLRTLGDHARVLRGGCLPYGEGITFWPVVEIVREAAGITEDETAEQARGKIAAVVGETPDGELVVARVASAIGLEGSTGGVQEIFWAVRRLLQTFAAESPLVVILDDVHWAEPTLLDLIEYLAALAVGSPVLLLCLARPDLVDLRPSWGSSPRHNRTTISLEPLADGEAQRLISGLLDQAELDPQIAARIVDSAEGNPLFVEEILRMMVDEGALRRDDGRWVVAGDPTELPVPPTMRALLAARVDGLQLEERAVLQRASVVGQTFWWGAVADLSPDAARAGVGGHLQTLVRRELILPDEGTFAGEDAFRFLHLLIRDAAYQRLPKETRAELHERFADWLSAKAGDRIAEFEEIVAYHLEQAIKYRLELGPLGKASTNLMSRSADALTRAGGLALARGDMPAAANLLLRAAALLRPEDERRIDVLIKLGHALRGTNLEQAREVLQEAMVLAQALEDERRETLAEVRLLGVRMDTDITIAEDESQKTLSHAFSVFEAANDLRGLASTWKLMMRLEWERCSAEGVERALRQALEVERRAGDRLAESQSLANLANAALVGPKPADEGIILCEQLLENVAGLARADLLYALAGFHAMQGRFDRARGLIDESISIASEIGDLVDVASAKQSYGYWLRGRPGDAERHLREACDELLAMGHNNYLSTTAACLAHALCSLGRLEEAEAYTQTARERASPNDVLSQVYWRTARARILARGGDFTGETLAREAVALAEGTDWVMMHGDALMDLAEVLTLAERPGEAQTYLTKALELFERKGATSYIDFARRALAALGPTP